MPRRAIKSVPGQIVRLQPSAVEPGAVPPKGVRAALIRRTKLRYPELSESQIARHVGCSRSNVHQVLTTFLANRTEPELRDFQANKGDIYDALQMRALESVTQDKLRKSSATSLVTAAAILEDKARTTRGQPTSIHVLALLEVAELIRERDERMPGARPPDTA
jgi:hypothetical protein